jgi:hypothetical protein
MCSLFAYRAYVQTLLDGFSQGKSAAVNGCYGVSKRGMQKRVFYTYIQ